MEKYFSDNAGNRQAKMIKINPFLLIKSEFSYLKLPNNPATHTHKS